MKPRRVPVIKTKNRRIVTRIPVPESLKIFNLLNKYESRSMHGQLPVVWHRAEDYKVMDPYGNCWIDFTSTIFVTNSGHSNPAIVTALKKMLDQKLLHTYTFAHETRVKFLKELIDLTPAQFEKAFLLSAGTEATECAVKLMRMYGQTISPTKIKIVSFQGSMHGRTMAAEMLKGYSVTSRWIGYHDPNIHHLPFPYPWSGNCEPIESYDWKKRFREDISALNAKGVQFKDIAGFIIESYLGWGAIFFPPDYIQELVRFAREYNSLVTFDEIQGGFGRTGKLFAYQHYHVEPDLLCLGKGLSGSLPLSAVIGRKQILDLPETGAMSSTHSANPLSCAAALANLKEIRAKDLVKQSEIKGYFLHKRLGDIKSKYKHRIRFVFGKGLLAAIIVVDPKTGKPDSSFASRFCERAMEKGLLLVHTGRESIKIGPPLTISEEALLEGLDVIDECFHELE